MCQYCADYRGEFTVANETYSVEPTGTTLTGPHRAYKESDSVKTSHTCGTTLTQLSTDTGQIT